MMMGLNLMDGINCASFFDQIDDLIDFLPEDKCEDVVGANGDLMNSGGFPVMWDDDVPNPDVFLSKNSSADLSAELYVPYEDIVQLELISNFVEDSFSNEGFSFGKDAINKKDNNSSQFQVLESSSSSSSSSNSTNSSSIANKPDGIPPCGPQRARSKRPRPATFDPRPSIQLVEAATASAVSEKFVESDPPQEKISEESDDRETKKKKKKKEKASDEDGPDHHQQQQAAPRKCAHCEITKTPQWRAGPDGPKTLCNACGVRYKSGRLFPEYRPAASPTFVPSVHSNSHKKVVEMRNKKDGRASPLSASVAINNDDDNNHNSDV